MPSLFPVTVASSATRTEIPAVCGVFEYISGLNPVAVCGFNSTAGYFDFNVSGVVASGVFANPVPETVAVFFAQFAKRLLDIASTQHRSD